MLTQNQWLYVTYFMHRITEFLCQFSILAFYLRVFVSPKLRLVTYVLTGLVTCFGFANTFVIVLQCIPLSYFWEGWKGETTGECTVMVCLFGFIRASIEIALDLAIISLLLPMLARL